jgi:FAD:protein FMN transferase
MTVAVQQSQAAATPAIRRTESVMGTMVSFDLRPGALPSDVAYLALAEARASLHRAEAVFSTWKSQSPMSRLRRSEIRLEDAPNEMSDVLTQCEVARAASRGWFDPWAMPGGLDPTGLVKGWSAQRALRVIEMTGVSAAMVNAGGDVAVYGQPLSRRTWRIGIRDPWDARRVIAVVEATGAIATSGTYERGDHVLDPHTGLASSPVASATVTGPDLGLADALATGMAAAGEPSFDWFDDLEGYEALIVRHDGSLRRTPEFPLAP